MCKFCLIVYLMFFFLFNYLMYIININIITINYLSGCLIYLTYLYNKLDLLFNDNYLDILFKNIKILDQ